MEKKRLTAEEKFLKIIDRIEARAMAMDGPVTPTMEEATEEELSEIWHCVDEIHTRLKGSGWVSSRERLPECNISVLVFIPEEDHHVTTGMWDISKKWVLLDEYRVPKSEVTYWRPMVDVPTDDEYTPGPTREPEGETTTYLLRALQMQVFDYSKELTAKDERIVELERVLHELLDDTCYLNHDGTKYFMWGRNGGTELSTAVRNAQQALSVNPIKTEEK
jgi:hypothetical protein